MLCGDIEINPAPKTISQQGFSVCYWNLNSIIAHNFAKIFLYKGCVRKSGKSVFFYQTRKSFYFTSKALFVLEKIEF